MTVQGVDFIPEAILDRLEADARFDLILNSVSQKNVVVIERALEPQEELDLISRTMQRVDADKFTGIKLFSLKSRINGGKSLFGRSKSLTFSVIAPSDSVQVRDVGGVLSLRIPS